MSSIEDVRAAVAGVATQVGSAYQEAGLARARIAEAVAVLDGLGRQHSEPLVPAELQRAANRLDDVLGLIGAGAVAVADLGARL